MKFLYDPPDLVKKIFSDFLWNSSVNKILLTFDDGPMHQSTELILEELSKYEIKALFFCVGENVLKYPQLTERIISQGHSIGNHTFNHKILRKLSLREKQNQILKFNLLMQEQFGYSPRYFRPPHGRFQLSTNSLLRNYYLKNVMWSLMTFDYKNNFDLVKFAVDNFLKNDSIVVFHDSIKSKNIIKDSISYLVHQVNNQNLLFGDPAECLK